MKLKGQRVLITGAARGIGAETARVLAAKGARLALVGLERDDLERLAGELGAGHVWYEADVTDQAQITGAVDDAAAAMGGLDVVVANAGISNYGTVGAHDVEPAVRTIEVNLVGVLRTAHAAIPHLKASGSAYLLLVSSAAAFTALPGMAAYHASKAGVENLANAMRLELAHEGVVVGSAHPGWIGTDLVRGAKDDLPSYVEARSHMPWPLGRDITVQRCARAFVRAIARRQRKLYVPWGIRLVHANRVLLQGPLGDLAIRRRAAGMVPRMDAEVHALGRSFGGHVPTARECLADAGADPDVAGGAAEGTAESRRPAGTVTRG